MTQATRPPVGPIDLHKIYPATLDPALAAYFRGDDRWSNLVATKLNQLAEAGGGGGLPEAPSDGFAYGRENAAWAKVLALAGGTLTGALTLAADPTVALQSATKQYVDNQVAAVGGAGGKIGFYNAKVTTTAAADPGPGFVVWNTANQYDATSIYVSATTDTGVDASAIWANVVAPQALAIQLKNQAGHVMNYTITIVPVNHVTWFELTVTPGTHVGASFGQNADLAVVLPAPNASTFLPLSGGTLTGPLILAADPTTALGAATKQYVDAIHGLPTGGTTGQVLQKNSATNYDTGWVSLSSGGTITGVTAGTGLTGGGTTGTVTLAVASAGITNALLATMPTLTLKGNNTGATGAPLDLTTAQVATMLNLAQYAPLASPTFTGTPAAPTATAGTSTTQLATTAFVAASFAPLASPALTGTPTAPTPATADNTTKLATTAYVKAQGYLTGNQSITVTGDVTGSGATSIAATVAGLQGRAVASTAPTTNQVLQWSGTQWQPASVATGGGTVTSVDTGTGLTGGPITGSGTISVASAGITNALLATMAANTLKGNNTGATAAPVDLTVAQVMTMLAAAPLASPTFTGTPAAPTASAGTSTTQLATTAFVTSALGSGGSGITGLTATRVLYGGSGGGIAQNALFTFDAINGALALGAGSSWVLRLLNDATPQNTGALAANAYLTGTTWSFEDTSKPAFELKFDNQAATPTYTFRYAPASANPPVWSSLATLSSAQGTGSGPGTLTVSGEIYAAGKIGTTAGEFYRGNNPFGQPSASQNGYLILGAITVQWGTVNWSGSFTSGSAAGSVFSFSRAFSAVPYAVFFVLDWNNSAGNAGDGVWWDRTNSTTSGFRIVILPGATRSSYGFWWFAIGPT